MKLFSHENTTIKGSRGEDLAERYLKDSGYIILERNFKNTSGRRIGEIDIIAQNSDFLVFVEVKTSYFSGSIPEENITRDKIRKLQKIISLYIRQKGLWEKNCRLDAISVIIDKFTGAHKIKHIENIFI